MTFHTPDKDTGEQMEHDPTPNHRQPWIEPISPAAVLWAILRYGWPAYVALAISLLFR